MHQLPQSLIVIDDEPILTTMISDLASELGWTVDGSAHSEAEGFKVLAGCHPGLALLDINLGLTTSLAIAATCRDRNIPIVLMTGYTARDVPSQCGDAPILTKPFSEGELQRAIERALFKATI